MASLSPSSPPTSVALPFEEEGNTPPTPTIAVPDQPHLLSLVLQSKKALQHGEQLCSRANAMSDASAQGAVDILALDAKVRWITDAVLEQLKVRTMSMWTLATHMVGWFDDINVYISLACRQCGEEYRR